MLSHVLNSHPRIECVKEILNDYNPLTGKGKVEFLAEFLYSASDTNGRADEEIIRGATLNPFKCGLDFADLRALVAKQPADQSNPVNVIVLTRENKLKQAISIYLAETSGWKSNRKQFRGKSLPTKQRFDVARLANIVQGLQQQTDLLKSWGNDLSGNCLCLDYESLVNDPQSVINLLFQETRAGATPKDFDFTAGFEKIVSDDIGEVVANLDEIAERPNLRVYLS